MGSVRVVTMLLSWTKTKDKRPTFVSSFPSCRLVNFGARSKQIVLAGDFPSSGPASRPGDEDCFYQEQARPRAFQGEAGAEKTLV